MGRLRVRALASSLILGLGFSASIARAESPEQVPPAGTQSVEAQAADEPANEPPDARPETEHEAREAFRRGDRAYLEGDYEGAVEAFEIAYAKSGRIEMLFNLANAHERLGHYAEAAVSLRGYIPHSPLENRPALEKRLDRLERLAEAEEARRNAAAPVMVERAPEEQKSEFPLDRALGIGAVTLGGAGLIAGTGFAISAATTRGQLNEECVEGESGRLCTPDAEALLERDRAHSLVADIAFIGGAVFTAVGVYLIVRSSKKRGPEVQAGPGLGSIWVRGTF